MRKKNNYKKNVYTVIYFLLWTKKMKNYIIVSWKLSHSITTLSITVKQKKEEKYDIAIVILINNVLTNILIILLNILII